MYYEIRKYTKKLPSFAEVVFSLRRSNYYLGQKYGYVSDSQKSQTCNGIEACVLLGAKRGETFELTV